MRIDEKSPPEQIHLREGTFNPDCPPTTRSSRSSSRSSGRSSSSSSSSSDSDSSYSSCGRSRSTSVSRRSRKLRRHGSRYSSSSSSSSSSSRGSRSRSRPRCCPASGRSRCRIRHRSRSYSPYSRRSFRYERRRYSTSRSSSRERYYFRGSRRSRSRSSSNRRTRVVYSGRFRCRFSPSPVRRSYRSRSPERSVWLSQKDKMELLNIAKENAAKILGVDAVKLPSSVKCIEGQAKKPLEGDSERMVREAPLKNSAQTKGETDEKLSNTSPVRKPINFSINNVVAKPSSSPPFSVPDSKVTSRADSVGNRLPYRQWIPLKTFTPKKR